MSLDAELSPDTEVAERGLPALDADAADLLHLVDGVFASWARESGARPLITPPLLPVAALSRLDFYDNFPHQALVVSPLDLRQHQPGARHESFAGEELEPAELALPSAACFAVYLHHEGARLAGDTTITVLGRCFRREDAYDGLRRLLGFHMREVIALGTREFTQRHLAGFDERLAAFTTELGLPVCKEAATDPFYDRGGERALLQRVSPVKHEYLVGDVAIASLNIHRNFFGERCDITLAASGEPVFTSCVAFGLERWLAVLHERFSGWSAAAAAVRGAVGVR